MLAQVGAAPREVGKKSRRMTTEVTVRKSPRLLGFPAMALMLEEAGPALSGSRPPVLELYVSNL